MSRSPAEESQRTKKAREKLQKQLSEIEGQLTNDALDEKKAEIQRWIARHAPHRVVLSKKAIALFDENRNAADASRRVLQVAETIKQED